MTETMGEIIKKLRKERNLTQEELAEQIGVTSQAVSKWENNTGMPDISQIIPLASVFDVSTDILFGLNKDGAEAAIEKVKKIAELADTNNDKRIELWSQLLQHYPRNNNVRFELAEVYSCRQKEGDYAAAAELLEKILDECTDSELRWKSLDNLCFCYNRMGDIKNAVRVAELLPPIHISKAAQLADIDGYEKRNESNQNLLAYCVEEAAWCLLRQSYETDENAIFAYRTALQMLDLLYYDGSKEWICYVYIWIRTLLCKKLAKIQDYESMYSEMEKWLEELIFKDSLPLGNYSYQNNIFLNLTSYTHDEEMPKGHGLECMLYHLGHREFDSVRNTDRFKNFLEKAKEKYYREVIGK